MTKATTDKVLGNQDRFTLFYDGECPLCRREIEWFCRRDPEAMNVVDISLEGFDSKAYGLAADDVHRELHGIRPDGTVTVGMDSVREAYRVIGLGFMVSFTAYWPFRPITDWMYRRFAANRLQIGAWLGRRKCDEEELIDESIADGRDGSGSSQGPRGGPVARGIQGFTVSRT